MESPIEFIGMGTDGGLSLNPKAEQVLLSVSKPMKVVAIAGRTRTGKSFLLNQLMGSAGEFPLESITRGIWIWMKEYEDYTLVLLDTEGFRNGAGQSDQGVNRADRDAKFFTLALLLSCVFVYNSKGSIDATALSELKVAAKLYKHMRCRKEGSPEELKELLPDFIWAVRDFLPDLDPGDGPFNDQIYLEEALNVAESPTADFEGQRPPKLNATSTLKECFPNRRCFTFPLPAHPSEISRLDSIPAEDLDAKFTSKLEEFASYLHSTDRYMRVSGLVKRPMGGRAYYELAQLYIDAIRNGPINIESIYASVAVSMNNAAKDHAILGYRERLLEVGYPISEKHFRRIFVKAYSEAYRTYNERVLCLDFEADSQCFGGFIRALAGIRDFEMMKNRSASLQKWSNTISIMSNVFLAGVRDYTEPGGYERMLNDVGALKTALEWKHKNMPENGPCFVEALSTLWANKITPLHNFVECANKKLSEASEKTSKIKQEAAALEAELKATRAQNALLVAEESKAQKREQALKDDLSKMKFDLISSKAQHDTKLRQLKECCQAEIEQLNRKRSQEVDRMNKRLSEEMERLRVSR